MQNLLFSALRPQFILIFFFLAFSTPLLPPLPFLFALFPVLPLFTPCLSLPCVLLRLPLTDNADSDLELSMVRHQPEGLDQLQAQTQFTRKELQSLYRGFKNVRQRASQSGVVSQTHQLFFFFKSEKMSFWLWFIIIIIRKVCTAASSDSNYVFRPHPWSSNKRPTLIFFSDMTGLLNCSISFASHALFSTQRHKGFCSGAQCCSILIQLLSNMELYCSVL